jgi:hypothetical protein
LLLFACTGCDLVLGLHRVDPPPVDAPDIPNTPHVSGTLREHVVTNAADLTPHVVDRFYPAATLTLAVTLDDGSTPAITYDETAGVFAFDRPAAGEPYRLHITTPDLGVLDYELTSSAPTIGLRTFTRVDSRAVTQPTTLEFQYGVLSGFALVASTGVGSSTNPQQQDTGTFDFDWKQAMPMTGSIGLLDVAHNDRLYFTEMTSTLVGPYSYFEVSSYASIPVTISDGATLPILGSLTSATSDTCASIHASRNAALARQLAAPPRSYTGGADWSIHAGPSHALGPEGLQLIVFAPEGPPATDVDVMPMFFNPFPGTELFASLSSAGQFNVQLNGAAPLLLQDLTRTLLPLDVSGTCFDNSATLKSEIAIPGLVTVDGKSLIADDEQIVLPTTDHTVTWASSTGPLDYANVFLYEVTAPANATSIALQSTIVTSLGKAIVPASQLVHGHTYIIQVENRLGYNVAAGDFDTIRYAPNPPAFSNVWSFTFQVM